jgi:hypothetical protein
MGRFPTEEESLKAISKLQAAFSYAATLLIYTVLERCLKLHLLQKRKTLTDAEVNRKYKPRRGKFSLSDAYAFKRDAFIEKFLRRSDLLDLGEIYWVDPARKYSKPRNDVFHSNLFFSDQLRGGKASRDKKNRKYLNEAKAHLIEASEKYFRDKIITELDGSLRFEH